MRFWLHATLTWTVFAVALVGSFALVHASLEDTARRQTVEYWQESIPDCAPGLDYHEQTVYRSSERDAMEGAYRQNGWTDIQERIESHGRAFVKVMSARCYA